jgi:hypothetical protein
MTDNQRDDAAEQNEFARLRRAKRSSFVSEYLYLIRTNKKWWMLPIIVIFLALGALLVVSGTGAAPFIYTLF